MALEAIGDVKASSRLGGVRLVIWLETNPTLPRQVQWALSGHPDVAIEGKIEIDQNLSISFSSGLSQLSPLGLCVAKCVITSILGPLLDCLGGPIPYIDCLKSKSISLVGHAAICVADCISSHAP